MRQNVKFNNVVKGCADFDQVRTLSEFGPRAEVGHLVASGTSVTHLDLKTGDGLVLRGTDYLVEIGPNASASVGRWWPPFHGFPPETLDLLTVEKLAEKGVLSKENRMAVAVSSGFARWFCKRGSPPLTKEAGDALRLSAAINGPLVLSGSLKHGDGRTMFFPARAFDLGSDPLLEAPVWRQEEKCAELLPYYQAGAEHSAELRSIALPAETHSEIGSQEVSSAVRRI